MTKQYILFIFSLTKEKSNIDYSLTVKTEKHSKKYKFTAHTHRNRESMRESDADVLGLTFLLLLLIIYPNLLRNLCIIILNITSSIIYDLKSQTSIVIVKLRTNPRKDKNQSEIKQSNYSSRK